MDPTDFEYQMELGGQTRTLIFDIDTYLALEKQIKQSHMNWLVDMMGGQMKVASMIKGAIEEGSDLARIEVSAGRLPSIDEFIAIVWASYHTRATEFREAKWLMTIKEVRRAINMRLYMQHASAIVKQILASVQPPAKAKPTEGEEQRPTSPSPRSSESSGGSESGPSDEDVLASLETI